MGRQSVHLRRKGFPCEESRSLDSSECSFDGQAGLWEELSLDDECESCSQKCGRAQLGWQRPFGAMRGTLVTSPRGHRLLSWEGFGTLQHEEDTGAPCSPNLF